ncbi:PREDICTED: probable 28S ribosomal protein S16, mitochondrial, partial [Nicrophorus vespilloides]|uniref:Small ribosomal subunit protein bS16m n=1 Tax=Nicrophorus vespilloides TaxID=110193 RepID=A0ABM1M2H6_NICVS
MLSPASGTGQFYAKSAKIIRFVRYGCTNRPFFHIVVTEVKRGQHMPVIEQLGAFDPIPNQNNEKLVSLNLE